MSELIVEFNKTIYDKMVESGILKKADHVTLYGIPVSGEIIRCRNCKYISDESTLELSNGDKFYWCSINERDVIVSENESLNGYCSWAERE